MPATMTWYLVCGVEKLFHENKMITYAAFSGAVDVEVRD